MKKNPLITSVGTGASRGLKVEYVRRKASTNSGLIYEVQFCDNLLSTGPGSWTTTVALPIVTSIDDTWERVVILDAVTGTTRRFGRVKVTYIQP